MNVPPHQCDDSPLRADGPPRLIVDLSNVCRERALGAGSGEASWTRFLRVMDAWHRQTGEIPQGVAVADANLRFLLSGHDRAAFDAAERAGIVRSVEHGQADREILQLAERHGACVLSHDGYRGHRRDHPWIQGCADRFFGWEVGADGSTRIVARDMGRTSASTVSRHAEQDELRDRGVDPRRRADRALLAHDYRCTNGSCLTARMYPDRLALPPAVRGGEPRCPTCGGPLIDLGPRPAAVKVVVERDGEKLLERTLEEGQHVELGRRHLDAGNTRLTRVSRRHVRLAVRDGVLFASDAGSRNGTTLIRWDERGAVPHEPVPLGREPTALGRRDVLELGGAVRLRRSGERFPRVDPLLVTTAPSADRTTTGEPQERR